jgi:hypothetical protein|nr:MAG TPA: Protein of unknown function (DUF1642) [Caudoviricetes sp.]
MNKQELKKHIEGLPYSAGLIVDTIKINRNGLLKLIEQLDEPQKPAVPQFVADWYEENKDDFEGNLFRCINTISSMYEDEELNDFENWVIEAHTEPFQTLVNMHQFGYTVEKEKYYTVRLKYTDDYLVKTNSGDYRFYNNIYTNRRKHTRKEIEKARFGWMFDCEGIEVKEVE